MAQMIKEASLMKQMALRKDWTKFEKGEKWIKL